jgi:transposase
LLAKSSLKIFERKVKMKIVQEQVGDLILLGQLLRQSGLIEILDAHYPVHGNWRGPSVGQLTVGWLMYIISECDHRVSHVETWVSNHIRSLRWALDYPELLPSHFQDDRLDRLLEYFGDSSKWESAQGELNEHLLRIYELSPEVARLDSVNVTSYRQAEGLFQHGARKKHQADLPQLKVMMANLDPLGMPLSCQVVAGHRADDQLYLPVLQQAQQSLPQQGMLYVGDSKLGNRANFAFIARSQNYYLCPLSQHQYGLEQIGRALHEAQHTGPALSVEAPDKQKVLALVYELPEQEVSYAEDSEPTFVWQQRLFLVQSPEQARRQKDKVHQNIRQAKITIAERFLPKQGRKTLRKNHQDEALNFIDRILKKYKVKDFLQVQLSPGQDQQNTKQTPPLIVRIEQRDQVIDAALALKSWRVFATNAPLERLDAQAMVRCYHNEYLIEQQFHRLLSKTTALMPVFLRKENRIQALIRLLMLALQLTALIQHKVRKHLQQSKQKIGDIIPGNPGRKLDRPTCEAMLKTFCAVAVVWVLLPEQVVPKVSALRPVNIQILDLLGMPHDLYQRFALSFKDVKELTINLSET